MRPAEIRTIEHCLQFAEKYLYRSGITRPVGADPEALHGVVILEYYDPEKGVCRTYRRQHGLSPFRTLVRFFAPHAEQRQEIIAGLAALARLRPYFASVLDLHDIAIPDATEDYLDNLVMKDVSAWPDDLYYSIEFDLGTVAVNERIEHKGFVDLATFWQRTVSVETALKNAIDLFCLGPWYGVSLGAIAGALDRLEADLRRGRPDTRTPLEDCLEPGRSWTCRLPLWKDGFQGFMMIGVAGDLEKLTTPQAELMVVIQKIADVIASALAKSRYREACDYVARARASRNGHALIGLAEGVQHMISPHRLVHATAGGQLSYARDLEPETTYGFFQDTERYAEQQWAGESQTYLVTAGGLDYIFEYALFKESGLFNPAIETIAIWDRIESIVHAFVSTRSFVDTETETDDLTRGVHDLAASFLDGHRGRQVSGKEYFLCFVCLALTEKRPQQSFRIVGNMVHQLQVTLGEAHGIERRSNTANAQAGAGTETSGKTLHISQLAQNEEAVRFVETALPGLKLEKGRGTLTVSIQI